MSRKPQSDNLSQTAQNYKHFKLLTPEQQSLVAVAMLERMLPNYQLFSQVCHFGDSKLMRDAVNILWEKQVVRNLKINVDKQLEKIEPNIPDVADFDVFGVYPALDFSMALLSLFGGISGANEYGFFDVCKLSHSSVSRVAEQELEAEGGDLDQALIESHELMQYENNILEALVELVKSMEKPNKSLVAEARELVIEEGISNIGIEVSPLEVRG